MTGRRIFANYRYNLHEGVIPFKAHHVPNYDIDGSGTINIKILCFLLIFQLDLTREINIYISLLTFGNSDIRV